MAQAAIAPIPVDQTVLSRREVHEVAEYEKILKLRDEVFTGKHSRLKVPSHAIVKAAAGPVKSPPGVHAASEKTQYTTDNLVSNGVTSHTQDNTPVISQPSPQEVPQPSPLLHKSSNAQRPPARAPSSSGIDPIFLTKSDDLVRAEIQLQRQRLERALKESADRLHKTEARGRSDQDPIPDFDVSEVLARALLLVPSIATTQANRANGVSIATDSFDENSYYSSQINDSPMDGSKDPQEGSEPYPLEDRDLEVEVGYNNGSPALLGPHVDPHDQMVSFRNHDDSNKQSFAMIDHNLPFTHKPDIMETNAERRVVREESEYSPPAANFYDSRENGYGGSSEAQPNEHRPPLNIHAEDCEQRPSQSTAQQTAPSSPEVRIVRNHIASPVAPQPSKVSPLAVAKLPPFARERRDVEEPPVAPDTEMQVNSARQSPDEVPQPSGHRKRRKKGDGFDRPRKHRKGKVVDSPEPYIKEEPESPPPLALRSRLRRPKPLQQPRRLLEIDDISPRDYRSGPRYPESYEDHPMSVRYEVETPSSATLQRTASRLDRRDLDLRRVASLQYTKRAVSPRQYSADFFPSDARASRAVSHAYNERREIEHPQYYREPVRSYAGHYIRSEQSRSPPPMRERPTSAVMGPPPRKVVVDQHGNRYYAAPPTIDLTSSVPPPNLDENVNPRYVSVPVRDHVRRAPVGPVEMYDDEGFDEKKAPSVARHIIEQTDPDLLDHRSHRHREYEPRLIEATIPQNDRTQIRQLRDGSYMSHVEPIALPSREYVPRLHSVRPDTHQYDAPREYISGIQSVRPELDYAARIPTRLEVPPRARGQLTLRPEDGSWAREYLPVQDERITYAPRPQSRGYTGTALAEWPRARIQELHQPEPRRASYRY
ncbi:MAG: hypothetical protein M1836_005832 [Candelina mexicana]|nr:MAG: hypothetical protein M1836_005832 [Candelina mexicana]